MDPLTTHARAVDRLREVVAQVSADAWDTVTNCDPWTASVLVNHALNSQLLWVSAVKEDPSLVDIGDVVNPQPYGGDHLARTDEVIALAKATWATDGVLDRQIAGAFGVNSGVDTIVYPSIDAIAHGWDLATSVGLDAELPDDLQLATSELIDKAVNDTTRSFGLFADEPELDDNASPTDRILARTGRRRSA